MSTKPTLEKLLTDTTPQLTAAESARMLAFIEGATVTSAPVASPYFSYYVTFKSYTYIAIVLIVLLGATGTVAASGSARPGDLLFTVDRATEEVRLALSSDGQKETLKNQFMTERFTELQEIVNEEKVATTTGTGTTIITLRASGEARVANAVAVLASQLAHESDSTKREQFLHDLLTEVSSFHVTQHASNTAPIHLDNARVKIDTLRTETSSLNERIKINQKNSGLVEIKYENRNRNPHATSDDSDDADSDSETVSPDTDVDESGNELFRFASSTRSMSATRQDSPRNNNNGNQNNSGHGNSSNAHGNDE